jgi:hypothetical protein
MTGIWFVPAESGWGVNLVQQNQTLFVTLFVYGTDNRPLWLVGPDVSFTSTDTSGASTFTGTLFQTSGPYFGAASFDPGAVGLSQVGTLSLRFTSPGAAQLTYGVNGVNVTKSIVPQTFRVNNLTGLYLGGASAAPATPSCTLPLPAGDPTLVAFDMAQSGTSITIQLQNPALATCTLVGTVTTFGKLADVSGTYTCSAGPGGQFAIRRLEAGIDGFSGSYIPLSSPGCAGAAVTIGGARVP